MGLLDKLWDETVAGPAPDSGLGKLRKHGSFPSKSAAASPSLDENVSRRIAVLRRDLTVSVDSSSAPPSPSGSTTPRSPFSPSTPGEDFKKLTRRKSESAAVQNTKHKRPTGYDWIVLSALDR